ncbi:lactate racemase domain-containing protein [Chloroflexota bacterium]
MKTVRVPQLVWYGNTELELRLLPSWDVDVCYMKGHHRPPLSEKEVRDAFRNPINSPPIRELARGAREVVILFDDMTRPTPVAQIIPYVLEELREAGVTDGGIRFIAALGAHGALHGVDFRKKLGEDICDRFPVYNHNPYENCTFVGTTSRGTPVAINSEVMNCDFKIGIGCIIPHVMTGFGGGGKIILPGVASMDTIEANHDSLMRKAIETKQEDRIGLGLFEDNALRLDIDEAARIAGLDVKIDAVVNLQREIAALFVGEVTAAHHEGMNFARNFFATELPEGADIVIANTYSKANEAMLGVPVGAGLLSKNGGDLVLITNTPEGQVLHYLLRTFGKTISGRLWRPKTRLPRGVKRLIIFAPYIDKAGADWIAPPECITWAQTWDAVVAELQVDYPAGAKVAVIPDGTAQYFPS